jgi:hypothetical protein
MQNEVNFYGSKEDLETLKSILIANGFKERERIFLKASGHVASASISFVIGVGIGSSQSKVTSPLKKLKGF